jgi:hypothetical protein
MVPHRRQWKRAQAALLVLTLPTSVLLWLGGTFSTLKPERPLFHPQVELSAMDTLNEAASRDAVVLCLKETGNVLPAWTDLKAYVGHGPETLNAKEKEKLAEQFFAGDLDSEARRTLLTSVDYVFFGPLEQEHSGADRSWATGLKLLSPFAPGDPVVVYEVPHD